MIKAIETDWKGWRFRSRTEARWAVYFETCGFAFDYEPEGFILSDGTHYLPDFFLSDMEIYVEIKGAKATKEERRKLNLLASESGKWSIMIEGQPGNCTATIIGVCQYDFDHEGYPMKFPFADECVIGSASDGDKAVPVIVADGNCEWLHKSHWIGNCPSGVFQWPHRYSSMDDYWSQEAIEAARSARFEHGQKGPRR